MESDCECAPQPQSPCTAHNPMEEWEWVWEWGMGVGMEVGMGVGMGVGSNRLTGMLPSR